MVVKAFFILSSKSILTGILSGISSVHGQCDAGMSKRGDRAFTPMSKIILAYLSRQLLYVVL
jgi:hypothetical protein